MPAAAVPAIIGAVGGIGSALIGSKGKKTEYTSGRSPQATALESQMSNYISQGLNKPIAYANVNPMSIQAMDMISKMFMGQGYTQPQYGMSAAGGGPTGMGMPQSSGMPGINAYAQSYQYPQMPQSQYGMPSQTGPQYPQRQFYGGRGMMSQR